MKKILIILTSLFLINCSKDKSKIYPVMISYSINGSNIDIKNNFSISVIKEKDTLIFYPKDQIINFKKLNKFNNYIVIFKHNKRSIIFDNFSNKMLNPSQKMEWKFGIENQPFKEENKILSSEEYNDKTIKKFEYLQFNPLEFGDGIEKINIIRK
jgi:hypothetical protein